MHDWGISAGYHDVSGQWRDVPPEYGPATTVYNRYNRWSRRGVWQRLFEQVAASGRVPQELLIDTSQPPMGMQYPTQDVRNAVAAFVKTVHARSPDAQRR